MATPLDHKFTVVRGLMCLGVVTAFRDASDFDSTFGWCLPSVPEPVSFMECLGLDAAASSF
jgi:hypothetical protein